MSGTGTIEFIAELAAQAAQGRLKLLFKKLARIPLIAIDELGYLKMDKEKESLFFQFIRHRYEKISWCQAQAPGHLTHPDYSVGAWTDS